MTIHYLDLEELADEVEDPDCSNDHFIYILRLFSELGCVEAEDHPGAWTEDELATLAADLRAFARDQDSLIPESDFEEHARELAEDIGAIDPDAGWPLGYIDWEKAAEALQMDYTAYEFEGETYYQR